jgi:hypothetical protein
MSSSTDDGYVYIYRRFIRRKDGTVLDARKFGLKAFRLRFKKQDR